MSRSGDLFPYLDEEKNAIPALYRALAPLPLPAIHVTPTAANVIVHQLGPVAVNTGNSFQVIGIDPGAEGALVLIDMNGPRLLSHLDMPIIRFGTKTRVAVDGRAIGDWISNFNRFPDAIVIESQQPILNPEAGRHGSSSSMFMLGGMFVAVNSIMCAFGIPMHFVMPVSWKAKCNLLKCDKDLALDRARGLFGVEAAFTHGRNMDGTKVQAIARAEAALIAYYGIPEKVTGMRVQQPASTRIL